MIHEDLKLWEAVQDVDLKFTKQVNVSGKPNFTNIDTYELIRMATEQFGSYGKGWGIKDMSWSSRTVGETTQDILDVIFFFPGGEFPYRNILTSIYKTKSGYLKIDDDSAKKLQTNTIAKCLSLIGFGSSIYRGQFEDAGYMAELYADQVELIPPQDVQKLIKGIGFYKVNKEDVLKQFNISHLKDIEKSELNKVEAFIKKLSEENNVK